MGEKDSNPVSEPGWQEIVALGASGAIGSALVYGYYKWIKKRP